jgi:TonB family protein
MSPASISKLLLVLLLPCLPAGAQNSNPAQASPAVDSSPSPQPNEAPPAPSDSTQLEALYAPKPEYPLEAAAKKLQGQVVIKLHISESGSVESTEIVSGEPILAQAAADAMSTWKFKPFIRNGRPSKLIYRMPFDFSLKGYFPDGCTAAEAAFVANSSNAKYHQVPENVVEGRLIHHVQPEYPTLARMKHVQGTVLLYAVIGEDGRIHDLQAICGPPELVPASLYAVRQWRYRPYELDGAPTPVKTTIRVQFHM